MIKKSLLGLVALVGIAIAVLWFTVGRDLYGVYRATAPHTSPEDYAQQDDSRIDIPPLQVSEAQPNNTESPIFFVWAGADLLSAPLQRIQVVKGWIDTEGATHEQVQDVVCSDGLSVDPTTKRCPDNGSSVDTATCETLGETGAVELMAAFEDPEYDPSVPATLRERARSSPIWIDPQG